MEGNGANEDDDEDSGNESDQESDKSGNDSGSESDSELRVDKLLQRDRLTLFTPRQLSLVRGKYTLPSPGAIFSHAESPPSSKAWRKRSVALSHLLWEARKNDVDVEMFHEVCTEIDSFYASANEAMKKSLGKNPSLGGIANNRKLKNKASAAVSLHRRGLEIKDNPSQAAAIASRLVNCCGALNGSIAGWLAECNIECSFKQPASVPNNTAPTAESTRHGQTIQSGMEDQINTRLADMDSKLQSIARQGKSKMEDGVDARLANMENRLQSFATRVTNVKGELTAQSKVNVMVERKLQERVKPQSFNKPIPSSSSSLAMKFGAQGTQNATAEMIKEEGPD